MTNSFTIKKLTWWSKMYRSVITFSHVIAFIWLTLNDSYLWTFLCMEIFLNGPVTNWGCGVVNSSWSALHTGHPSYRTCHFFFLFNSFFSASTVLFSPVLFQIARIQIFGRLKKNNFFFRVESWRSRPIRSTEDVTRWNRSNHFLNFFLKCLFILFFNN